ncbi:preprotein translocase subunit YajC [Vagococcus fluvialis]|jgi:preprotein translocase subunit YajC|uniref:preprotein translocase subunit YajC n=1 Tax=Vagococcus fluvialis TaxID=2738 RepID=UPI001A8C167F|nr:preprotein translocase subunit YajC [Vagococcus fluvialis]MDR2277841.1 preprotein translocase subunit YajC [Vagococcus sp.]MBO0437226.1 preprotein translocase subunit YajC [Vagococcus fluvialis]MBO0480432.1 preprotein translocase subunit YajC [Vagococcus fluvialis]MBO0485608.1 preprotein translocase subunit YajC [Vagococcus fluvialis]MCM2139576.1 preprotein translocase subunit YajC [Vagococcus fluvialis]
MTKIGVGLLVVLGVLYLIVLPIAKKKYQSKQQKELKSFVDQLVVGDQVIMNSGIVGTITKIEAYLFHINIAEKTVVRVDKHSVLGKFKEK